MLVLGLFLILAHPVQAAAFVVTNLNDSGAGSLRAAIQNANGSAGHDTITFNLIGCPCVIPLSSTLVITDALTLSGPGASSLALDGGHTIQVIRTTNVPVAISGLTIRNGNSGLANSGGGINAGGVLTLTQVTVQGNTADDYGGGVLASKKAWVIDSVFENNSVTKYDGGGMYANGALIVTGSQFSHNRTMALKGYGGGGGLIAFGPSAITATQFISNSSSDWGGGAYLASFAAGTLTQLTDVQFISNTAQNGGGGLFAWFTTTLNTVDFSDNFSSYHGGGVYIGYAGNYQIIVNGGTILHNSGAGGGGLYAGNAVINVSQFKNNHALNNWGGGFFAASNTIVSDTTFTHNTSFYAGGAIGAQNGSVHVTGGRFESNQATGGGWGGAIYNVGPTLTISGTQFYSNTAETTGGAVASNNSASTTITGAFFSGNSSGGDGGALRAFAPTHIAASQFQYNTAHTVGGGVMASSDLYLNGTDFIQNTAVISSGGAVYGVGLIDMSRGLFQDNSSAADGGAIYAKGQLNLERTQFLANQANSGGAIFQDGGGGTIVNTLFARNHALSTVGEALALKPAATLTIEHSTIASPTQAAGSAIFVNGGAVVLLNNIIATHTVGIVQASGAVNADYNLFFGNGTNTQGGGVTNNHPVTGNPGFFDPLGDDYHLGAGSTAVNAGPSLGVTIDFDGDTRPQGSGYDLGYDEVAPPEGLSASNDGPTPLGQPTTFSASVTFGNSVSYEWDFGDSTTGSGSSTVHTYAAPGVYHVTVTAANGAGSLSASTTVTVFANKVYLPIVRR